MSDYKFTTNMDSKFRRENSCIKLFSQRDSDVDEAQIYSGPEYICDPNSSDPTKPVLGLFKILPKGLAPEDFMGLIVTKTITDLDESPIVAAQNSGTHCRFVVSVEMLYDYVKNESPLFLNYSSISNQIDAPQEKSLLYPSFYYPNSGYFGNRLLSGEVVVDTGAVEAVVDTWVEAGSSAFTPQEIYDILDSGSDPELYVDGIPQLHADLLYTGDETEAAFSGYNDNLQIKVAADKSVTILAAGDGYAGQHAYYIQIGGI